MACACRAMAYRESERAKQIDNPGLRRVFTESERSYSQLAVKLERARGACSAPGQP